MASSKYSSDACSFSVSWESIPLTSGLFLAANLIFLVVWSYDIQFIALLSNIAIIYLIFSIICKILYKSSTDTCKTCETARNALPKWFEETYNKTNSAFDWIRRHSTGTKAIFLSIFLIFLQKLNLSLFSLAWFSSLWVFLNPALLKFLKIDVCKAFQIFLYNNPYLDNIHQLIDLIPRASSIRKAT
jgi:hypothetical protein